MSRWIMAAILVGALAGRADAAEMLDDGELKIRIQAPEGFRAPAQAPAFPEAVGEVRALWTAPDFPSSAGLAIVHRMTLPDGTPFAMFKTAFPRRLEEQLGNGFRLLRQEDVRVGALEGFVMEFEAPGNGTLPEPNGARRHRVRWYLFPQGENRAIGLGFHALEAAWKELEPRFAAAFKTLKPRAG